MKKCHHSRWPPVNFPPRHWRATKAITSETCKDSHQVRRFKYRLRLWDKVKSDLTDFVERHRSAAAVGQEMVMN